MIIINNNKKNLEIKNYNKKIFRYKKNKIKKIRTLNRNKT